MRRCYSYAVLLLAAALLAACSGTRLAYDHADVAVRWMADDYFALAGAQEEDFSERLARFHAWHRSEELPRYSTLMAGAGGRLDRGLTQQDLDWAWDNVNARYRRMAEHAAPDLAAVFVTLTPGQFEHLERKFAESNAKYAGKYLDGSEAEQRRRSDKRNLELVRKWFGDLTDEQEAQVKSASTAPLLYALRLQNRQRRQQEFVALLKAYRSPAELESRLRRWLADWQGGNSPEFQRLSDLHRERYMQMLLELDRSLAPAQRAHAVARLNEYGEIFAALAGQGKLARADSY